MESFSFSVSGGGGLKMQNELKPFFVLGSR